MKSARRDGNANAPFNKLDACYQPSKQPNPSHFTSIFLPFLHPFLSFLLLSPLPHSCPFVAIVLMRHPFLLLLLLLLVPPSDHPADKHTHSHTRPIRALLTHKQINAPDERGVSINSICGPMKININNNNSSPNTADNINYHSSIDAKSPSIPP